MKEALLDYDGAVTVLFPAPGTLSMLPSNHSDSCHTQTQMQAECQSAGDSEHFMILYTNTGHFTLSVTAGNIIHTASSNRRKASVFKR